MPLKRTSWNTRDLGENYQNHGVFSTLEECGKFYDSFSMSIMSYATMGTKALINIDTYLYSSIQGTLESISQLLRAGRIGDAFALLRKYHDSVVINIYTNLYLEDHRSLENFIVTKINNWINGSEQLPEFRIMSQYIQKSPKLSPIITLLLQDDTYKRTRDRCNANLHYNLFENVLANDNQIYIKNRIELLNQVKQDLVNIFVYHLSCVFYFMPHYMSSSDYLDALEMGMTPEEDSQYWVADYIQKTFNRFIVRERPDVAKVIVENTSMRLTLQ